MGFGEVDRPAVSTLCAEGVTASGGIGKREKNGSPGSTTGVDRCCAPLLSMATASKSTGGAVITGIAPSVEETPEVAAALRIQTPIGQVAQPPDAMLEAWRSNLVRPLSAAPCAIVTGTEGCGRPEAGPNASVVWFHPSSEPCIGTSSAGRAVGTITCQ